MTASMLPVTKAAALAAVLLAASGGAAAQDAFGYTASSAVPYSYVNIASTGTSILPNTDDGTAVLTPPFLFRFYGTSYSSLCVSTNGLIAFGGCPANDVTNLDLTSQSPTGNLPLIAPFWMDLSFAIPGAGSVVYQTLGTPGSRLFVIQWNNAVGLNAPGALNFQVVLAEGTNTILFQYQTVETASLLVSKGAGATVGIRAASGNTNNQRLQWSYKAAVLSDAMAIRFTPPASAAPVDVSASIRATTTAFVYNRLKQTYAGAVTITNIGTAPLARPLTIVLTNVTPGVTALNPTGSVPGQGPYYLMPGTAPLGPSQISSVPVEFSNPANARISFVVKTYSGSF